METIPKSSCVKIGFIQKPHGINGELVIRFREQYYETLEETSALFLEIENLLVPFFISDDGVRFRTGESAIVKLEWTDNEKQAKELAGCPVFVKKEQIKTGDEIFDIRHIEGYLLLDQRKNQIGTITGINNYSGNIILQVDYHGREVLVPFNEDVLIQFEPGKQILILNLADGLLTLDDE